MQIYKEEIIASEKRMQMKAYEKLGIKPVPVAVEKESKANAKTPDVLSEKLSEEDAKDKEEKKSLGVIEELEQFYSNKRTLAADLQSSNKKLPQA